MGINKLKILKTAKTKLNNEIQLIATSEIVKNIPLVIGVFHGDEPQGKFLIEKYLDSELNQPHLLFIPCLNPDGMELKKRTNSNNVDLNRNFPTKNWGENKGDNATCDDCETDYYGGTAPSSEIETQFLVNIIEKYKPTMVLTLHSPYKVVNYDGPAKEIAEKISNIIKYPTEGSIGYPTPGSFGTWAGIERNIPVITLELDEEIPVETLVPPVFEIFNLISTINNV